MDAEIAARGLEALGSPTRLEIFRLLVRAGRGGAPVGAIQAKLEIPPSTLSHHIARLVKAGLVTQERQSRSLICRAEYAHMDALVGYLLDNCCEGLDGAGKRPGKAR
jgi:ArsR family transcriptional regulator